MKRCARAALERCRRRSSSGHAGGLYAWHPGRAGSGAHRTKCGCNRPSEAAHGITGIPCCSDSTRPWNWPSAARDPRRRAAGRGRRPAMSNQRHDDRSRELAELAEQNALSAGLVVSALNVVQSRNSLVADQCVSSPTRGAPHADRPSPSLAQRLHARRASDVPCVKRSGMTYGRHFLQAVVPMADAARSAPSASC